MLIVTEKFFSSNILLYKNVNRTNLMNVYDRWSECFVSRYRFIMARAFKCCMSFEWTRTVDFSLKLTSQSLSICVICWSRRGKWLCTDLNSPQEHNSWLFPFVYSNVKMVRQESCTGSLKVERQTSWSRNHPKKTSHRSFCSVNISSYVYVQGHALS